MNSIYTNRSQVVTQMLKEVEAKKILLVPLDFAKEKHVVRICDATGDYLHKKSFDVTNNQAGLDYLCQRIDSACGRKGIQKKHVLIATESPHSYCLHFMHELQHKGYIVLRVNAAEAKKFRKNSIASSDTIDLDGIANAVLNRRARPLDEEQEIYSNLKRSSRYYKRYKKDFSRQKNRIGKLIDEVFPGFLNIRKSGIKPYSRFSIELMSKGCSIYKIRNMKQATLVAKMRKYHIHHPVQKAIKLQAHAAASIAPSKLIVDSLSRSLEHAIQLYKALEAVCDSEWEQLAISLVQTPYSSMLSLPGVGVVRATTCAAEFGHPDTWSSLNQMCSYAGIAPRTMQSGGPDKPAIVLGLSKKCNRRLKDALLQAAHQTALTPHTAGSLLPQLKEHKLMRHYKTVSARNGKSGLSTARMIIRKMRGMVRGETIYLPAKELSVYELKIYVMSTFEKMHNNLKGIDLDSIKPENNCLTQMEVEWKHLIESLEQKDSDINL